MPKNTLLIVAVLVGGYVGYRMLKGASPIPGTPDVGNPAAPMAVTRPAPDPAKKLQPTSTQKTILYMGDLAKNLGTVATGYYDYKRGVKAA